MFGTTRTAVESLLDVGENLFAALLFIVLVYLVKRSYPHLSRIGVQLWDRRSSREAAVRKITDEISWLSRLTENNDEYLVELPLAGAYMLDIKSEALYRCFR